MNSTSFDSARIAAEYAKRPWFHKICGGSRNRSVMRGCRCSLRLLRYLAHEIHVPPCLYKKSVDYVVRKC